MSSTPHDPVVLSDAEAIDRIFHHIDHKTTDTGAHVWREPVEHYFCEQRFLQEQALMRRLPIPFCPSGALLNTGDFLARRAAGRVRTPPNARGLPPKRPFGGVGPLPEIRDTI